MPQVLGVLTALALPAIGHIARPGQRRLPQELIDACRPARRERLEPRRDAGGGERLIGLIGAEELRREPPKILQCDLYALTALLGTVAEANEPAGAVAHVITSLLEGLGRDRGETRIGRILQSLVQLELVCIEQRLPHDGVAE